MCNGCDVVYSPFLPHYKHCVTMVPSYPSHRHGASLMVIHSAPPMPIPHRGAEWRTNNALLCLSNGRGQVWWGLSSPGNILLSFSIQTCIAFPPAAFYLLPFSLPLPITYPYTHYLPLHMVMTCCWHDRRGVAAFGISMAACNNQLTRVSSTADRLLYSLCLLSLL